jgi:hypothetical protein
VICTFLAINQIEESTQRLFMLSFAWIASAAVAAAAAPNEASSSRSNVLFMMADQLRWDATGYAGNEAAITPWLDRIASEGVSFSWSGSSTPTCTPARAAILTGQSPWNHGMLGYGEVRARFPSGFGALGVDFPERGQLISNSTHNPTSQ